jgi:tetratricopeptide (TPR) repeat protein
MPKTFLLREARMGPRLAQRVLLIGWDAADWQIIVPLVQSGQMPYLQQLLRQGVHGNLTTLMPILSPLLWTSIATGKRADKHGILGFVEPDPDTGRLRPVSSTSRQGKAIWNILTQEGLRSHVVGWFASHPAEPINGVAISNLYALPAGASPQPGPVPPGAIHPRQLEETLAPLRVHPSDPRVPRWVQPGQADDPRLAELAGALAECLSIDQAASWILEHQPWDFLAVYYNALDHISHHFMPFHPPWRPGISTEEFGRYQHVIASAYRHQDQLLGPLLQKAGPETTVLLVSDHGFFSDARRPVAARWTPLKNARLWHRPLGIVCLAGPGIKAQQQVFGASILDVTPTVLTLFGLPAGADMDGRPLLQALTTPQAPEPIPSWDPVPGEAGLHPPGQRQDPWDSQEALRQLVALGYLEEPGKDQEETVRSIRIERTFTLALHFLETGRPAEALPHFAELHQGDPGNVDFRLYLARCRFQMGQWDECGALLARVERQGESAHAALLQGRVYLTRKQTEAALAHLLRAVQLEPRLPALHETLGETYLQRHQWDEARQAFTRAVELDPDSAQGHLGLAHVALIQHRLTDAVGATHRALTRDYHLANAHFVRGIALARLNQAAPALEAFETCLKLDPRSAAAHKWLAALHEQATGDQAKAAEHRRRAAELER